jgi:hypothetical protein
MGIRNLTLLSAYLLSDGGLTPRGKESWTVYFRNKDPLVIDSFQEILKLCTNRYGYRSKRRGGSFNVKLHSSELGRKLLKISNSYRTKACMTKPACPFAKGDGRPRCLKCEKTSNRGISYPKVNIPDIVFESSRIAKDFLRIYSTCDGGVSVTVGRKAEKTFLVRRVFISVKHPTIKTRLMELLKILGYNPYYYDRQIRLTKKEDILRFEREINFLDGAEVSKDSRYLHGHKKSEILKRVSDSYTRPREMLDFMFSKRSSPGLKGD